MSTYKLAIDYGVINIFLKRPRYVSINENEMGIKFTIIPNKLLL